LTPAATTRRSNQVLRFPYHDIVWKCSKLPGFGIRGNARADLPLAVFEAIAKNEHQHPPGRSAGLARQALEPALLRRG